MLHIVDLKDHHFPTDIIRPIFHSSAKNGISFKLKQGCDEVIGKVDRILTDPFVLRCQTALNFYTSQNCFHFNLLEVLFQLVS